MGALDGSRDAAVIELEPEVDCIAKHSTGSCRAQVVEPEISSNDDKVLESRLPVGIIMESDSDSDSGDLDCNDDELYADDFEAESGDEDTKRCSNAIDVVP